MSSAVRGIACAWKTAAAEGTLCDSAVGKSTEWRAPMFHLVDDFWRYTAHQRRGVLVGEVIAAFHSVIRMPLKCVVTSFFGIAQRSIDAALCRHRM